MKTLRYLILAGLTLGMSARAAEFTELVLDRYRSEQDNRKDKPSQPKIAVEQKAPVVAAPSVEQAEEREDRNPFSNWRNFIYTYGSPALVSAAGIIALYTAAEKEIDPKVVATQAIMPAAIALPADIIKEGGKKLSKSLTDGHDLVSPLSDTINKTAKSLVVSRFYPEVPCITKREVGENLATDIMYALPKFTLACAIKEALGWTLGWPFKRSLDTWQGLVSCLIGDALEGWVKGKVKRFIRKEIINDVSSALFGPKDEETEEDEEQQQEAPQLAEQELDQEQYQEEQDAAVENPT